MTEFSPVRFGILGAANIARQFTKGLAGSTQAMVTAAASRTAEKATEFAADLGIPRAHPSYQALLDDPDVEAIYIPLPNDLHAEWALRAIAAGKHVLCEKPLCMTRHEAKAMFAAARAKGVLLAEAYPYMSQPQTLRVRELVASGAMGRIQLVQASFGFALASPEGVAFGDPANIRLDPARGGGALLDAGTYAMSFVRLVIGERPTKALALATFTKSGVDLTVAATLAFPSGAMAQITTSMATANHRHATIMGEKAWLETGYGNHAPPDGTPMTLRIRRGTAGTLPIETESLPGNDGFRLEAESFARAIRLGANEWNGATEAESIDVVMALEAIAKSARTGEWVEL